jgi:hypothetical protein
VLKEGLSRITQSLKVRKDGLNAKLAQKEAASDYEHGVKALDELQKVMHVR